MKRFTILAIVIAATALTSKTQAQDGLVYADSSSSALSFLSFEADFLFWSRDNQSDGGNIIGGPESFSFGDNDFGYEPGYRLDLGIAVEGYELEAVYSTVEDWRHSLNGFMSRAVAMDAGGVSSTDVDPSGSANFINASTFFNPLFTAASYTDALPANDETTEFEHINQGAAWSSRYQSEIQDFELNLKTADASNWLQVGFGYRNLQLNEQASASLTGLFDTFDADGDEVVNDPNDSLSHTALTHTPNLAGGYPLISGGGTGWDDDGLTTLALQFDGAATNHLSGAQAVFDLVVYEGDVLVIDGFLKGGVYHNRVRARASEMVTPSGGASNSVYGRSFTDAADTVSFVGGVALNGAIKLTEHVRLIGGWEVLFLSNVALAPDQGRGVTVDAAGTASFNAVVDGHVIAQGGKAGLMVIY